MGYDRKYGYVTTERGDIKESEPVIVFRAQDGILPSLLNRYYGLCKDAGSPQQHLDLINETFHTIVQWQEDPDNYVKLPPTSGGPAGQSLGLDAD